jgi:hypothetical protein
MIDSNTIIIGVCMKTTRRSILAGDVNKPEWRDTIVSNGLKEFRFPI